jgi:hypothetical protein
MTQQIAGVDTSVSSPTTTFTVTTEEHYHGFDEACKLLGQTVAPKLRLLRESILEAIDASIPNKDQNRAVKNIVRKQFDKSYTDIVFESIPSLTFTELSLDRRVFTVEHFSPGVPVDSKAQENP